MWGAAFIAQQAAAAQAMQSITDSQIEEDYYAEFGLTPAPEPYPETEDVDNTGRQLQNEAAPPIPVGKKQLFDAKCPNCGEIGPWEQTRSTPDSKPVCICPCLEKSSK